MDTANQQDLATILKSFKGFSAKDGDITAVQNDEQGEKQLDGSQEPAEQADLDDHKDDGTGEDTGEEVDSSPETDEPVQEEKPKKAKTAQDRINELTKARREAERRLEVEKAVMAAKIAELEAQLKAPKQTEPSKVADKVADVEKEPDPTQFEYGELDPKFIRAMARWEAKQEAKQLESQLQQRLKQVEELEQKKYWEGKREALVNSGKQKYDDFDEVVVEGIEKNKFPVSPELAALVLQSEVGADIAYHLASHPDEASAVYTKSPLEQAAYFGRLEARFSANLAAAKKANLTKAPPPPEARARGAGSAGKSPASLAESEDFSAFEAAVRQRKRVNG
jgi:hypothetical protein